MECGEIDFAHILAKHQGVPLGLNFIRVYWEQMLRAVQVIHDEKIVHSDLKPANFLLVQGQLKLIDFGIAKRMGDDTTNIHRDQQVTFPKLFLYIVPPNRSSSFSIAQYANGT